jgi:hypothetical protein
MNAVNIVYSSHFDPLGHDGISQHFADLASGLGARIPIDRAVLLTKRSLAEARDSDLLRAGRLGETHVLARQPTMTLAVVRLLWNRRLSPRARAGDAPATLFLFGYHWLLWVPLLRRRDRLILVSFDCWSGRERRIAETERRPVHRLVRFAFARLLLAFERRAASRLAGLAMVSQAEIDKFCAGAASAAARHLAARAVVLPPRGFALSRREGLLAGARPEVLVWADCRVPALLRGAAQLMTLIGQDAAILAAANIALLSRASDEALAAEMTGEVPYFVNHRFVDDVEAFISGFDIIIVPDVVGSGVKNRTLQSLATGALVIATGVASEGLNEALIEAIKPAETLEEIVEQLRATLSDRDGARHRALATQQLFGDFLERVAAAAGWETRLLA